MNDQYLIKGVICEVTDGQEYYPAYFDNISGIGNIYFTHIKNGAYVRKYNNYRVIGTIWDYAPEWATHWVKMDNCYWINDKNKSNMSPCHQQDFLTITGIKEIKRPDWSK